MSAKDDLVIFLNIMAQSDSGIGDPQLIGKFSKAKAMLHNFDSFNAMQAQVPPPMPTQSQDVTPPIGQNIPPTPNQPQMIEGQGTLNLP